MHCTLTVWTDRAAMPAFLHSPAHRRATAGFPFAGKGRVAGFAAARAPNRADVPALLRTRGRGV